MSMIMMLERVAEGGSVEQTQPAAVADKQAEPSPLRIFNGEPTADACEVEGLLPAVMGAFISGLNGATNFLDEIEENAPVGTTLSLEKAWHGLHFLLTGDSWGGSGPQAFLVCGGTEQGEDYGYGPARYFASQQTREIANVLSPIEVDNLWSRYDAQAMTDAGIYPEIWDEPAAELAEEYCEYFQELQEFMAEAAEQGDGLLVYLT